MSHLSIYLLALSALWPARPVLAQGGLQDLASFPKYQVEFLNDLPLSASDAAAVRLHGLRHEDEFLAMRPRGPETIDGDEVEGEGDSGSADAGAHLRLMPMRFTPPETEEHRAYLCAMPSANTTAAQTAELHEPHDAPEPDPEASWRALSHLDGKCLYLRIPTSWFTYAYCHNKSIRQFHELPVPHPHDEGFTPKEDPEYPAYVLGQAHPKRKRKAALPPGQRRGDEVQRRGERTADEGNEDEGEVRPEQTASFGHSHASRYLVQRWRDGTPCDLTGRPREVEVQVYCSMTGTDMIYMVKEIVTCQYVVVIHSPNLCSLPGFRPATDEHITPAAVRCREVLSDADYVEWHSKADERERERQEALEREQKAEQERKRLRLEGKSETQKPFPEFRRASEETDPKIKIEGLEGLDIDDETLRAILATAFGLGGKADKEGDGASEASDADAPPAAADHAAGAKDDLYVVGWEKDADGNVVPVNIESVPPTEGESRRDFLKRLQAVVEKELSEEQADGGGEQQQGAEKDGKAQLANAQKDEQLKSKSGKAEGKKADTVDKAATKKGKEAAKEQPDQAGAQQPADIAHDEL